MDLFLKVRMFINSVFTDLKYKSILCPVYDTTTSKPSILLPTRLYVLKNRKNLEFLFRENFVHCYQYIQIKSLECYAFECFITHSPQRLRHMLIVPALVNVWQL